MDIHTGSWPGVPTPHQRHRQLFMPRLSASNYEFWAFWASLPIPTLGALALATAQPAQSRPEARGAGEMRDGED